MTGPIRPQAASGPTTPLGQRFNALVEALKAAHARVAVPMAPEVRRDVSPALMDSLTSIAGRPSAVRYAPGLLQNGVLGEYDPRSDVVSMAALGRDAPRVLGQSWSMPDPELDNAQPPTDYTLAHELGHRTRERQSAAGVAALDSAIALAYGPGYPATSDTERSERFARAFAAAMNQLRATATLSPQAARQQVNAADSDTAEGYPTAPGVDAARAFLLRQPIMQRHPLAVANRMDVKPDATVTPRPPQSPANTMAPTNGTTTMQQILAQALLAANKKRQAGR